MNTALCSKTIENNSNNTLCSINQHLIDIKAANRTLPFLCKENQINTQQIVGFEGEYTIEYLLNEINVLVAQLLTMTARRTLFLQRTSYSERKTIQSQLSHLLKCLLKTNQQLSIKSSPMNTSCFVFSLLDAPLFLDALKPFTRMFELIIAQEQIHLLSTTLNRLMDGEQYINKSFNDYALTDEQTNALELSPYLVKQAL